MMVSQEGGASAPTLLRTTPAPTVDVEGCPIVMVTLICPIR